MDKKETNTGTRKIEEEKDGKMQRQQAVPPCQNTWVIYVGSVAVRYRD
jgi:hypothetical protein